jgi:hypothetical protein
MVIRAATYGTADYEHGGEDVYECHSSSTYFKQFHQSIKANTHVTAVLHIQDTTRPTLSDRMDEWISKQNTLIKVARERQSMTDHHALVEYDPTVTEYPINSYVLFTPPVGRSDKLLPRHRGPYQVLEKSHSIYVIEDLVNGKRISTHIHNLRLFNYDPARTSPLAIAQQNEQEFVVESINRHRGNRQRRSTMEFKVHWAGFGESCDSWEPCKALLSTSSTIICEPM